jgi:hypothetical protein
MDSKINLGIMFSGGPVAFASTLQRVMLLSSAVAEYSPVVRTGLDGEKVLETSWGVGTVLANVFLSMLLASLTRPCVPVAAVDVAFSTGSQ